MTAAIDDATDPDDVADLVLGHIFPDLHDLAHDFVPDDLRIGHQHPFAARVVQIGMANATNQDSRSKSSECFQAAPPRDRQRWDLAAFTK